MLSVKVKSWLKQFKQYYFTYSKGFYHLPCNGSSPETLLESLGKFPFVKHAPEKQCISSSNPFCAGGFYYHQLEPGCWIMYSKLRFKSNVAFDLIYDTIDDGPIGPQDYYMLSLNYVSNAIKVDQTVCEKYLHFPQYSWTLFKPRERNCDLNFKGAQTNYLTFYFNEEWLNNNLLHNHLFIEGGLDRFMASEERHLMWPLTGKEAVINNFDLFDKVMNIGGEIKKTDLLSLKYHTLHLIFDFFKLCKDMNVIDSYVMVEYPDKFSMSKVEHYLSNHLLEKFPGITFLAEKFNISETKLKSSFKQLFGKPVYQYFQEKQMLLAKEVLSENQYLIKEISYKLGYENTSKFSAAFKKHHGFLPSELPNQAN